ncbi:MAG: hypothetical protein Q4E53_03670 [Eubacteriales bacterium]|nr:hypothetical protein [Eubacteriales bacterium]
MKIRHRILYGFITTAFILFVVGFYLFRVTLNHTKDNIIEAHDDHLYDLGYTIDKDVYEGLDDLREEMTFALTRQKITIAENNYIQSHKIEKLKDGIEEYVLSRYSFLQYVIVHYDNQFLLCMENGEKRL